MTSERDEAGPAPGSPAGGRAATAPEPGEYDRHDRYDPPYDDEPGEAGDDAGRGGRRWWRTVLLALLTAGVVGSATWVVFFSPVLGVREIEVVGNLTVPSEQITRSAGVADGHPLATVDLAAVRGRVLAIRRIESAEVRREWPGTLRIDVVEREPVAVLQVAGKAALIDRYAVVTEVRTVAPPRLPILHVNNPATGDPATRAALAVIVSLPEALSAKVAEVRATTAEDVTLTLGDGRTVIWGGADRPREKASILTTLLRRPAKAYNVSSPEVVTVR
ncbi:cell division protein FtsQ [Thermocatellispora tengchongensis]|uniref:Cell division protein FtsQ n=1 Tax=Thermocatellispora tengchongensis TaxID=1073253 RepID=A0A840NSQ3_9ACTN|nr:FtsQ-type POTRA domain-containing protein [Thermocatellispora tengchongensis]MBB5131714.1 cell division protein FtsQ [Thermocatellispora tengchongensis]